jgi:hypothetical protein
MQLFGGFAELFGGFAEVERVSDHAKDMRLQVFN